MTAPGQRRGPRPRSGLLLVIGLAAVAVLGLAAGGRATAGALARSRPPEPLPRLVGPLLSGPTGLHIITAGYAGPVVVLDVDHGTVRSVHGLGLSAVPTLWSPRVGLTAVAGGALAVVARQDCGRCARSETDYVIASDGSVRRVGTLQLAAGTVETTPALGSTATWLLSWPHVGSCTLRLIPGTRPATRVPCADLGEATEAGLLFMSGSSETIVNPLTGRIRARAIGSLWPIGGDLALENSGQQPGGTLGTQFGRLSLVGLAGGTRRPLVWPSYFGNIIRVVSEPTGPLVAVDFGSPAYPGPAQAEDIWILNRTTGTFSHLPGYPAQVDIKASNVVWTHDDRLVIVAHGGGRTVLGIWKPGQATLPLRTVPNRSSYNDFVAITG